MLTNVVGVTFSNEEYGVNRQEILRSLSGKEHIFLLRDRHNKFDDNAIAVMVKKGENAIKIGYLKRELAAFLSEFWKEYEFLASIIEIRGGDKIGIMIDITKRKRKNVRLEKGA